MSFELRTAGADEVDVLLELWQEAAENDARPVIVADEDGQVVGSVIAGWDGWRFHLYRLAVRPGRRGQGIGSALVAAAEDRFRALDAGRADAMVLEGNELGQGLWRARGYAPQEEWRRWVKPLR